MTDDVDFMKDAAVKRAVRSLYLAIQKAVEKRDGEMRALDRARLAAMKLEREGVT